jgi:hypothetical protein
MATFVFTDASVTINSVNLSDHVRSVTLDITSEEQDDTAMSATFRSRKGGLKDGSISLEFNSDFAASEVDATIFPILGTSVAFDIRPTSGSVSSTNPKYTGNCLVTQHVPFGNAVGDLATVSVTWPTTGTISRATS